MVNYGANGSTQDGNVSISLLLNGAAVPNSTLTDSHVGTGTSTLSKSILIQIPANSTLQMTNAGEETLNLTNASIMVALLNT